MLFNSYQFIFFFLPVVLIGFFVLGKRDKNTAALVWLVACSLFFYSWWNPIYLLLMLFSILFNYLFGIMLTRESSGEKKRKWYLITGVALNIGLLGYFKYTNFFIDQINLAFELSFHVEKILLPLAISFFTFQQIAYLVDAYRRELKENNLLRYCLFVTFFPQLIAGPIVHHKEMLPQFKFAGIYQANARHIAIGLSIFAIGLFKKIVFADNMAIHATPVFGAAEQYAVLTLFEAWGGALAYTAQLYFDFSGYSDMAIGLAYLIGIKIPINFNSPYKSTSIIEFWRRWHMTLSRFLRDYLYFSLGGNRKGNTRRYVNLFLTMVIGGIWHGAGWTFVIWGALHGSYLMINHSWRKLRFGILNWNTDVGFVEMAVARFLTLLAVIIGWVYFRAESIGGANHMLLTMFGFYGVSLPSALQALIPNGFANYLIEMGIVFNGMFSGGSVIGAAGVNFGDSIKWILLLMLIAISAPNSQQLISRDQVSSQHILAKYPTIFGIIMGAILFYVFINLQQEAEFLYFNF